MNIYGVIALILAVVVFAFVFNAVEPIGVFIKVILNMEAFESYTMDDPFTAFALKISYLVAIAAVIRLIINR